MRMDKNTIVIGIDHGWSQMKTSNYCFNTSIKELPNVPAFTDNVLQYDNRHFAVGDERLEVLDSKVENENFYLLTLVAMAKEMKSRGLKEADIALAVQMLNGVIKYYAYPRAGRKVLDKDKVQIDASRVIAFYDADGENKKTAFGASGQIKRRRKERQCCDL